MKCCSDAARDGNGGMVTISFSSEFLASANLGDLLEANGWCTKRGGECAANLVFNGCFLSAKSPRHICFG